MPNVWLPNGVLDGFREQCMEFYYVSRLASVYSSGY